ncbi:YadA-like family protein [Bartonella sp. CM100XJJH]|uniref:YadA-like family protein n=1 Tax=Bartonella sp. CM100XJJH TaxID=3243543 RepID=UPI0035D008E4
MPWSLSVCFGSGLWRSLLACAIGAVYMSEDGKILSNISVTSARGHRELSAGVNLTLN